MVLWRDPNDESNIFWSINPYAKADIRLSRLDWDKLTSHEFRKAVNRAIWYLQTYPPIPSVYNHRDLCLRFVEQNYCVPAQEVKLFHEKSTPSKNLHEFVSFADGERYYFNTFPSVLNLPDWNQFDQNSTIKYLENKLFPSQK